MSRYIHANYRFIVHPQGDYRAQAVDADVHLDWNSVLQILVSAQSQSANCPICLSRPTAPRMAKCGHIFCLPCLIRYMHSTDDTSPLPEKKARWKKCPICWDSVYISETRSVRWFAGQEGEAPREGGDVVLRLISRQLGSTLALPRDGAESMERADEIPWYFAAEVMDYARVMKGSEDYMAAQYECEITELQRQEREDELMFGEETLWTKKAISAILEAREKLKGIGNPPIAPKQPTEKKPKRMPIKLRESNENVPDYYLVQHAKNSGKSSTGDFLTTPHSQRSLLNSSATENMFIAASNEATSTIPVEHGISNIKDDSQSNPTVPVPNSGRNIAQPKMGPDATNHQPNDSPFYFYEALLHYYLSPLDIRILKAAFGDFSSFPTTVLPRVERVSTGHIVDDDLRRRAKYLAHLPYGCEVGFLECDWTDLVSPEILQGFSNEIDRRRKRNREKEMREEKERVRAEKEEDDKRWAAARRKRPAIVQETVADLEFQPLPSLEEKSEASSSIDMMPDSSLSWASSRVPTGSAFASLASPSTSPVTPRTVWGTTAVAPTSPLIPPKIIELEPSDNDGWLQDWERDLLQDDSSITHFEASSLDQNFANMNIVNTNTKKKKGKKITLMTTNARRGA